MNRTLLFCVLLAVGLSSCASRASGPLRDYQWKNRLIVLFAPSAMDTRFTDQFHLLNRVPDQLVERDLIVIQVLGPYEVRALPPEALPLNESFSRDLRKKFHVADGAFTGVLVGKDGGEKMRWTKPIREKEIFKKIDAMPMRREEMKK